MAWIKSVSCLALGLVVVSLLACQQSKTPSRDEGKPEAEHLTSRSAFLNKVQAPFAVGSQTLFIHDKSRPFDAVAGVELGVRTLITELWYPASPEALSSAHRASYGDYVFADREVHRRMMSQTSFFHLTTATVREGVEDGQINAAIEALFVKPRASYVGVPLAQQEGAFPVIVMSHGDAGSRYNMQSVAEYLAAHGYIVIAAEHTGNSPYSLVGQDPALQLSAGDEQLQRKLSEVLPLLDDSGVYGHDKKFGQSYIPAPNDIKTAAGLAHFDAVLLERVNDLRAVIKQLESMNQQGRFAGRIDVQRIGLMGRSFGGLTTLAGLALEPRFKAGMAVVPPAIPDLRPLLPKQLLKPKSVESVILNREGPFALLRLHKPTLLFSGAEDAIIIAANQGLQPLTGLAGPNVENPHPVLRALFEQAEVPAVWGLLANTNHGSLAVAAPYWWPHLKPEVFPRVLSPQQSFTLMPSEQAHNIQKQKALQFFDVFVKGKDSAKVALRLNQFELQDLSWDTKNF